ncbi:MAG: NnrU family protein [Sterolibacteriaceae bacterium]|uniref:NnrU family protein n=1 Tax=Candidatus Methylophosphatis roskildensis TaxID=2899263 RepID=A0A9D7E3I7_9PROT|nr:NnrU family protein [Candidatus Methylophosphatis roskildensis]MBK7235264.1 NnrU family protein [Sterolibacteriaceae bacterium]
MTYLVLGLLIFLGAHSIRIVADGWRTRQLARVGEQGWKGLFSVVSLIGFVLLVWGYGQTRVAPIELWQPPLWTRHLAALLTLISFVLLAAAYVPGNRIKAALGHPMLAGTKVWAFAHLIANGRLADLLLFGAFLVWSIAGFIAARRRDRFAGTRYPAAGGARDALAVSVGVLAWVAFAFWGHLWLIGVAPFG